MLLQIYAKLHKLYYIVTDGGRVYQQSMISLFQWVIDLVTMQGMAALKYLVY